MKMSETRVFKKWFASAKNKDAVIVATRAEYLEFREAVIHGRGGAKAWPPFSKLKAHYTGIPLVDEDGDPWTNEKAFYTKPTLEDKLRDLLNKFSKENGSDTPDWILAAFMLKCLDAFDFAVKLRESYYGREEKTVDTVAEPKT